MDYPNHSIIVNNREVTIADILNSTAPPQTEFEQNTFSFIRNWFSGSQEFTLSTSGSTGEPKQISVRRSQMEASAISTQNALGLTEHDTALISLNTKYIAGQMMLVRCFTTRMKIVALEPEANPMRHLPLDHPVTFAALVPFQLEHILQSADIGKINSMRNVIIGGAPASAKLIWETGNLTCRVFATYGMTETISHIALMRLNGEEKSTYFTVLPGVKIETDSRECLIINAFYLDHPLVTNDMVELINETAFRWLGRYDNVINTGGVKVSPEVIESILEGAKPGRILHERFVISSMSDPALGERLVCVIESGPINTQRQKELLESFRSRLPKYHDPKEIRWLHLFPETKTGKIDRAAIKKMLNSRV